MDAPDRPALVPLSGLSPLALRCLRSIRERQEPHRVVHWQDVRLDVADVTTDSDAFFDALSELAAAKLVGMDGLAQRVPGGATDIGVYLTMFGRELDPQSLEATAESLEL